MPCLICDTMGFLQWEMNRMISMVLMAALITPGLMAWLLRKRTVLADGGKPIAGARVFLEPGLAGAVLEAPVSAEGKFKFDDVPPGGPICLRTGIRLLSGKHVNIAVAEEKVEVNLTLHPAAPLKGRIIDNRGCMLSVGRGQRAWGF